MMGYFCDIFWASWCPLAVLFSPILLFGDDHIRKRRGAVAVSSGQGSIDRRPRPLFTWPLSVRLRMMIQTVGGGVVISRRGVGV